MSKIFLFFLLLFVLFIFGSTFDLGPTGTTKNGEVNIPLSFLQTGYVTNINVGTPEQTFTVEVSTLDQGIWVSSTFCTPESFSDGCKERIGFNSSI